MLSAVTGPGVAKLAPRAHPRREGSLGRLLASMFSCRSASWCSGGAASRAVLRQARSASETGASAGGGTARAAHRVGPVGQCPPLFFPQVLHDLRRHAHLQRRVDGRCSDRGGGWQMFPDVNRRRHGDLEPRRQPVTAA